MNAFGLLPHGEQTNQRRTEQWRIPGELWQQLDECPDGSTQVVGYDYELLRDELLKLCDTEQDVQALALFINWLRQLAHHGKIDPVDFERMKAQYRTREEMKSMLLKALEQERDTLRQEGYDLGEQKGIEKGIEKGKFEAQRQTVLRLLQWRFAPTAAEQAHYAAHLERIDNLEALLYLVDQVLSQPTLAAFAAALQPYLPPTDH